MSEKIVLTNGKTGEDEEFFISATFGVDDYNYAALEPVEEDDSVYIFRMEEDEGEGLVISNIEDEEELKFAIEAYEELVSE